MKRRIKLNGYWFKRFLSKVACKVRVDNTRKGWEPLIRICFSWHWNHKRIWKKDQQIRATNSVHLRVYFEANILKQVFFSLYNWFYLSWWFLAIIVNTPSVSILNGLYKKWLLLKVFCSLVGEPIWKMQYLKKKIGFMAAQKICFENRMTYKNARLSAFTSGLNQKIGNRTQTIPVVSPQV